MVNILLFFLFYVLMNRTQLGFQLPVGQSNTFKDFTLNIFENFLKAID